MSDVGNLDVRIYKSDIDHVELLERDSFKFALCNFLVEVDGSEYPGATLYHLVVSIQKHLNGNGKGWKLVKGMQFPKIHTELNNLMKAP